MKKKVYVLLADGFELIEALTPVDVLRRGGVDVVTVSINDGNEVMSAQKVAVKSDITLSHHDITDGDMLVLPGGYPGYENLANSKKVVEVVRKYAENDKYICAICGAPTIFSKNGILKGKSLTCHHSVTEEMKDYKYTGKVVEKDGKLITAIGAGKALDFGIAMAEVLVDAQTLENIKKGMEILK